jgi:hypothetical protein
MYTYNNIKRQVLVIHQSLQLGHEQSEKYEASVSSTPNVRKRREREQKSIEQAFVTILLACLVL